MDQETNVAPDAATQITAPVPAETTDVAEPTQPTEGADPAEAKVVDKTPEQKELEYLRRKATKADRNNARLYQESQQLRQRLEEVEKRSPAPEGERLEIAPQEFEKAVRTQAQELARADRINERCNAIVEKGSKQFSDFSEAVATVGTEMPLFEPNGLPTPALEVVLEADNPPALLHYLGKNPNIAAELADLSPTQLARRLDRIERDMKQPRQPSSAPKPLEPVKASASPSEPDPVLQPAKWREWRNKTAKY